MKIFLGILIVLAVWFVAAWLPWIIKDWFNAIRRWRAKKRTPACDQWIFEDKKKEERK